MSPRKRTVVLFATLAGTVGLVVLDPAREERPARPSNRLAADARSADAKPDAWSRSGTGRESGLTALPGRSQLGDFRGEVFGSRNWQPPPLKSAGVLPSAPSAPPMPYRYAGKLVREGELSVLLSKGDTVIPIREGDTLDGAYRVESIGESQITLMYLPMKHRESIPVFSSLPAGDPASAASAAAAPDVAPVPSSVAAVTQGAASAGATAAPRLAALGPPSGGAQVAESGPARLQWAGPQQVKLGSRFEVALKVTSGEPLQASPMQLRFNPAHLEFVAARPGKFFGGGDRNFMYRAGPDGSIFIGASSLKPATAADAELLILTFRPVNSAPAVELSVASLNLQGPAGRPIAFGQPGTFRTAITP